MIDRAVLSPDGVTEVLAASFANWEAAGITVRETGARFARLSMRADIRAERPGGTVSGPTLFMLADTALYVAVLASVGPQVLAVTSTMTINFLRKPPLGDLDATCRLLRLGRRQAYGEVFITVAGDTEPVAHATGTFALPLP